MKSGNVNPTTNHKKCHLVLKTKYGKMCLKILDIFKQIPFEENLNDKTCFLFKILKYFNIFPENVQES